MAMRISMRTRSHTATQTHTRTKPHESHTQTSAQSQIDTNTYAGRLGTATSCGLHSAREASGGRQRRRFAVHPRNPRMWLNTIERTTAAELHAWFAAYCGHRVVVVQVLAEVFV